MFGLFAVWITINALVRTESTTVNHASHCNSQAGVRSKKAGDIVLGGLFPVHVTRTKHGRARYFALNQYALTWVEAMMFAVQEVNDNTELLVNNSIGFDIRDSCNQVSIALKASLDFVLDADKPNTTQSRYCLCDKKRPSISAVIGGAASPISTNIANVFGVDMTPQISYSSTSILLSDKDIYPSFYRTLPSDTYLAKAIADVLKTFKWSYVSIVASDNAYGRAGMDALLHELKEDSICTAIEAIFHPNLDKSELHKIINSLKSKPRSRVIVLWCQRPNALGFLEEATELGLTGRTWIGTETWGDAYQLKNLSTKIVGGMLGLVPRLERHRGFEEHLQRLRPNNSMHNPWMWDFWQEEYGCYNVSSGVKHEGDVENFVYRSQFENVTIVCPRAIDKGVPSANNLPRNKYTNVMDAVYAVAHTIDNIHRCKNGSGLLKDGKCPELNPIIEPRDISVYLSNVSFRGKSNSTVMFDANGDLLFGSYSVKLLQPSSAGASTLMDFIEVGFWSGKDGRLHMKTDNVSLLWNGWSPTMPTSTCADACLAGQYAVQGTPACCWTCVACERGFIQAHLGQNRCTKCADGYASNKQRTACVKLKENYFRWGSAEGISVLVLNLFAIGVTVTIIAIFIQKRQTAVVKASNQELSFLHLGSIVSIFIVPFLQGRPTTTLCCVRTFMFAISFTLCTSIMLLKTDRLLRIFRSRSRLSSGSRLLTNRMQIIMAMCMTSLPVTFCVIWFLVYPPEVDIEVDATAEDTLVYDCGAGINILQLILLGYVLILALICTYFAFKARTLPENFNEARFIGFAMFSFCLFWMCFVPVFQDTSGATKSGVYALTVVASGFAVVAIMYSPKLNVMLCHPEQNTTEAFRIKTMATIMRDEGLSPACPTPRGSSCQVEVPKSPLKEMPDQNDH